MYMYRTKAKVVRVGSNWQVLVKHYGVRPTRMKNFDGPMKWDCRYNSKESVERVIDNIWHFDIVQQFR